MHVFIKIATVHRGNLIVPAEITLFCFLIFQDAWIVVFRSASLTMDVRSEISFQNGMILYSKYALVTSVWLDLK